MTVTYDKKTRAIAEQKKAPYLATMDLRSTKAGGGRTTTQGIASKTDFQFLSEVIYIDAMECSDFTKRVTESKLLESHPGIADTLEDLKLQVARARANPESFTSSHRTTIAHALIVLARSFIEAGVVESSKPGKEAEVGQRT